jgi:hypothetical protein
MCVVPCHVLTSNHLAKSEKNDLRQSSNGNNGAVSFCSLKRNESMFLTKLIKARLLCSHTYDYIVPSTSSTEPEEKQSFSYIT